MNWTAFGSALGLISVMLGAFGTHGLKDRLDEASLSIWHTSSQYLMYHALALILLGIFSAQNPTLNTKIAGYSFIFGCFIFSGSLYLLALTGIKILGAITPIGGLCLMAGWILFFMNSLKVYGRN